MAMTAEASEQALQQRVAIASASVADEMRRRAPCEYATQERDVGIEWVRVAACAFPALLTVSKAKRECKRGHLLLNHEQRVATNVRLVRGDCIQYYVESERCPQASPRPTAAAPTHVGSNRSSSTNSKREVATTKLDQQRRACFAVCVSQGLRVVYENDALAVVVKPAGIHVKGRGARTVESALSLLLTPPSADQLAAGALVAPRAVHRLDARVGGMLLVAKTRRAETHLAAQFEAHSVRKQYCAIVIGRLELSAAATRPPVLVAANALANEWQALLPAAVATSTDDVCFVDAPVDGKPSCSAVRITSYSRSERYGWLTTVALWPLTGRKHQLRIHTALLGHPIVGDDLYHRHSIPTTGTTASETAPTTSESADAPRVVRGRGLFLTAVAIAFADCEGNRRSFAVDEPLKFARFRRFCAHNWAVAQWHERHHEQLHARDDPNTRETAAHYPTLVAYYY